MAQPRKGGRLALDKRKEDIPDGVYSGNTSLEPEICMVHCLKAVGRRDGESKEWAGLSNHQDDWNEMCNAH